MAARPALTALGCLGCQRAVYRAVLSSSPAAMRMLPVNRGSMISRQQLQPASWRPFSTQPKDDADAKNNEDELETAEEEDDTPWFLDEAPPRHPPSQHTVTLPTVPEDSPALLGTMIKYIYEDMGLDSLSLLDLRDLDPPASLGPNLIMLFGTARSERHLHVASGRFVRWVRRNYRVPARAEGLIGAGELKTKLRRLRKKAKLMGQNTAMVPGGDNGISTGWVCVNFRALDNPDGHNQTEETRFDESGAISGFGAAEGGTTIVVQCMTEARRAELELETLWKGILRRNLDQQARIRGETPEPATLDGLLASRLQLHEAPGTAQFDAMQRASQQQRHFSTSARRLAPVVATDDAPVDSSLLLLQSQKDSHPQTAELRRAIMDVQVGGAPMDQQHLETLVSQVLRADAAADIAPAVRLSLVDQLLQTAGERGLDVRSRPVLTTLIESLVLSPVHGAETLRAQTNFEHLLSDLDSLPTAREVTRLMTAHASRADWPRFWDAFRTPTRFGMPRAPALYELAYHAIAATGDPALCTNALRWVYPEMLAESTPVQPVGAVYHALKACILVADPMAESYLVDPPSTAGMSKVEVRALARREFVRVLREVEALRMNAGR